MRGFSCFNDFGGHFVGRHHFLGGKMLFLLILIIVIVYLFKTNKISCNSKALVNKSALDILNERYAKGEISKEEFLEMKKDIQN